MKQRFALSLAIATVAGAAVLLGTARVGAQTPTRDVEAIKESERKLILGVADDLKKRDAAMHPAAAVPKNWKPARTAWGDPDLSGVYSNSDEAGIPFERPAEFEGRRLEDITPAELDRLAQARRNNTLERAVSASDDPEGHPELRSEE